ncbi:hypothetical protein COCOR_06311 [Corallococcus coralloides DSM 2259]|uniref:Uncharacterized protein n=1 Tax=Corallococcus coralloides (strain ATCC 25202 / DSM 2259 / NBRC 100086 / M2) TaxID=1144275 RepID=H8MQ78_CORCM|nr:hypothetical protein [Corallococcus coralloides]AFE06859.1 hypothetical protein COCOR_06311 [Corallococcus coralloides DSM 2259]
MRMDRRSFWLLDAVVELSENLAVLRSPDLELITNRRTHGLEARELAPMLASLCEAGLIWVKHLETDALARTLPEIESALAVSSCTPGRYSGFWYGLTPEGGAVWESLARPDWSRYSTGWSDGEEHFIEAGARELAEEEFARASSRPSRVLVPGSAVWTVMRPWSATYWKTMPVGFQVRYRSTRGK